MGTWGQELDILAQRKKRVLQKGKKRGKKRGAIICCAHAARHVASPPQHVVGYVQFRAVSYSLYGSQEYHRSVRQKAVEYMQVKHLLTIQQKHT